MRGFILCACVLMALGCGQQKEAAEKGDKPAAAPEKAAAETPPAAEPQPDPQLSEDEKIAAVAAQIPELAAPYMTILEVRKEESALHEKHKDDSRALVAALKAWAPSAQERLKPACIAKETLVKPDGQSPEANKLAMVMLHLGSVTLELSDKDRAIRDEWDKETRHKVHAALEGTSCSDLVEQD